MTRSRYEADIIVVGAGMAGLTAALRTQELGCDVVLLEKGPRAGGSMYLSQGVIWTLESTEAMRERIPHGDPGLQELVVESLAADLAWLEEAGADLTDVSADVPGVGKQMEPPEFTALLTDAIDENNDVLLETPMTALETDDQGAVTGVTAQSAGERIHIAASSVILATGGFQGSEALVEQYITDHPENLWLRSNPWSTGDGLTAARDCGAKTTVGMSTFYGHSLPAPPATFTPSEFGAVTQHCGPFGIAIDRAGERFTDESESGLEETLAQDVAQHADGRAYFVIDQAIYDDDAVIGHLGTMVDAASDAGGRVATEETLDELGSTLTDWGVDGPQAVRTIEAYNEAVRTDAIIAPPRDDYRQALESPPYYAIEVQPGITFTMGGLDVTADMAVVRQTTSSSSLSHYPESPRDLLLDTIPGLFAAGVDVGNVYHRTYGGGLALALVTGKIAAESAAAHNNRQSS